MLSCATLLKWMVSHMLRRFFLLIAATLPIAGAADIRIVEEIVAKVNGDIITRGEIDHNRQLLQEQLRQQGLNGAKLADAVRDASKNSLRDQIDQLLLVQKAKDLNLNVDADLTRRLAEIQVDSKITDPDKFHQYIQEQTGMSFEDFKQKMKDQMLTQKVIGEEISSRITIPEADLRKYYDEHKTEFVRQEQVFLSRILISTEGKTPEQVKAGEKKAADLVARARKGEKFSDLARQNSDDPDTAKDGGYVGPVKKGFLRPEIEKVVFSQKRGYVTDPINIPGYLAIFKVEDHYEQGQASFEEVKNEINEKLAAPRMEPKVRDYLTRLREDAFLEIKDGYIDSGAAPGKDTHWKEVAELKPQTVTKEEVESGRRKKFLGIIPHGGGKAPQAPVAPPPASTGPAKQ